MRENWVKAFGVESFGNSAHSKIACLGISPPDFSAYLLAPSFAKSESAKAFSSSKVAKAVMQKSVRPDAGRNQENRTDCLQELKFCHCSSIFSYDWTSRDSEDHWESCHLRGDGWPVCQEFILVCLRNGRHDDCEVRHFDGLY